MEEARKYLHSEAEGSGPISGLLNWLSNSAFGMTQGGLGGAYRAWRQQRRTPEQRRWDRVDAADAERRAAVEAAVSKAPEAMASLTSLLLMSDKRAFELVESYPQVLSVAPHDLAERLVALKQLLPWHDVAAMIELHPRLLGCEAGFVQTEMKRRLDLLVAGMPGANLSAMVQEYPWVLLIDVEKVLPQLQELWPGLDADAFAASEPGELALALRALSWSKDEPPPIRPRA